MGKKVRLRWVAVFASLLCLISAVPVLAEPSAGPEPSTQENPPDFDASKLPGAPDIAEGINELKVEEAEREQQLNSPAAVEEREESEDAHEDLSPAAAEQLLAESFEEMLGALDADPARYLSEEKLLQPLGETAATVSGDDGRRLLDSSVPVRARDEQGDLRKVNLTLQFTEEGLEPVNPIVPTAIAASAGEGVEVGSVAISQMGVDADSTGRRFEGQSAFFPEVQPSTDLLVAPTSTGVELFDQLRAAESPETLRFDLDLPEGAEVGLSEGGGAEVILTSGKPLGRVSAPKAVDAQGTIVPVQMQVEGTTLVLSVEHRDAGFAYPILVDPQYYVIEDWIYGSSWFNGQDIGELENPNIWGWDRTTTQITNSTIGWHNWVGGSNRGLFTTSTYGNFSPWQYGQWSYWVPDWDVYIDLAYIDPFWRNTNGCNANQYTIPAEYDGLWNEGWNEFKAEEARKYNWSVLETWGKILVIGMTTAGGGPDPCYRDLYVGGVGIWMADWADPELGAPSGMPSGWITDGSKFTVNANAFDAGLGVKRVTIVPKGAAVIQDQVGNCIGTRASKCPEFHTTAIPATADDFDEGETASAIVAEDPTGRTSGIHWWTMKVDRTPPKVTLSGQLANLTNEAGSAEVPDGNDKGDRLGFPVYNLTIAAEDGAITADPKTKRSGVREIEVFLDGKVEEGWYQPCPLSSCPMTRAFQLKLAGLSAGQHALRVVARDYVGKVRERKIEFEYFPATGIKDEYVMQHFSLPDGKDHSEEEVSTAPELAVNLMNGNLVYHERDVDIEGPGTDLEVERFYNSQLPPEQDTEWGAGWTLAQTPELDPIDTGGSPAPDEAGLLDEGGSYDGGIELPANIGEEEFDPELQAAIEKTADGYELSDETGEAVGTIAFDESGRTEELQTSGETTVDYSYEAGALAEIAIDDPGATDLLPDEIEEPEQEPSAGPYTAAFPYDSFGTQGEGEGELEAPADIARDGEGNTWVLDTANHSLLKFDEEGEPLLENDSAPLNRPAALAIASDGNVLVADTDAVLEFNAAGEFLSQFEDDGGSSLREFNEAQGIAVDPQGNFWVANTLNGQLQKYDEDMKFIRAIGQGQLGEPTDIELDGEGNVWVVDSGENQVVVFSDEGQLLRQFGSSGSGDGEFQEPNALDLEPGIVWVGDSSNGRVQWFDEEGEYLGRFGSAGAGQGQFGPGHFGLEGDGEGNVWIADGANHRIQQWIAGSYIPNQEEADLPPDDPAVEIETDDGLVSSLEGEEAGEHVYAHEGDLLTAHEGPEGETAYEYDGAGRMTKVTLPNGTWAAIEYSTAYGRVKAVTVDSAGAPAAKTTHFSFSEEPRRTTVAPGGEPHVTYDIGPDGSVLKWWNTQQPPDLDDLAGGLYSKKETATPIPTGDHDLKMQAHSEEGIASIEVIANGNTVVDEKHCEQDWEDGDTECLEVDNEWVTNTANWSPGILYLEVIATDELGMSTSERFWVNIPYTPPTPEGQPDPPTFHEILKFREEFGLDLDLDPQEDESDLNDRIFDLIGNWYLATTPLGEVARASYERWGVPLRPVDVAELEYREWYSAKNGTLIDEWGEANRSATYAGYFVDHRSGGKIHVGFTHNQDQSLAQLKEQQPLVVSDRIRTYVTSPSHARSSVRATEEAILSATISNSVLAARVTEVGTDEGMSTVQVGTSDVALTTEELQATLGAGAPFTVIHQPERIQFDSDRSRNSERVRAGDWIFRKDSSFIRWCNAGFGAFEDRGPRNNGSQKRVEFLLTAGHCGRISHVYQRSDTGPLQQQNESNWTRLGVMKRNALPLGGQNYETDGAAIDLESDALAPWRVATQGPDGPAIDGVEKWRAGSALCFSSAKRSKVICRQGLGIRAVIGGPGRMIDIRYPFEFDDGDSGAPVWNLHTGAAVGLVSGHFAGYGYIAPLLRPKDMDESDNERAPGILRAPGMGALQLLKIGE